MNYQDDICTQILGEIFTHSEIFVIDTMPIPVCKLIRAKRYKKVQGLANHGYCASKCEYYFGWRLHLVCDQFAVLVALDLLPAKWDELTPFRLY